MFDVAIETRKLSLSVAGNEKEAIKELPLPGETFLVEGRTAFAIAGTEPAKGKPWVWYAPTLPAYPAKEEKWMFEQLIAAGISIAGIDVGESCGSPAGRKLFTSFFLGFRNSRSRSESIREAKRSIPRFQTFGVWICAFLRTIGNKLKGAIPADLFRMSLWALRDSGVTISYLLEIVVE